MSQLIPTDTRWTILAYHPFRVECVLHLTSHSYADEVRILDIARKLSQLNAHCDRGNDLVVMKDKDHHSIFRCGNRI